MAPERELKANLESLHSIYTSSSKTDPTTLLSRNKLLLLHLNALTPSPSLPTPLIHMARTALELGALLSIRAKDTDSFTRYYQQLQPFYALPADKLREMKIGEGQKRKVTGLYLLLLLSMGDYLSFHMLLEALEVASTGEGEDEEEDEYIRYPVTLERALMEGSYDRVWGETKGERVPDKEFAIFSQVCSYGSKWKLDDANMD
jgi:26S proteasome regulatory subunit N12